MCNSMEKSIKVPHTQNEVIKKKVRHGGSLPSRKVLSQMVNNQDVFDSPVVVSEVKARYRLGPNKSSNKAELVNWKGNIPVIKFNFADENDSNQLGETTAIVKKRHRSSSKKPKNTNGTNLLFKSATADDLSGVANSPTPKPLRKKHHSCKDLNETKRSRSKHSKHRSHHSHHHSHHHQQQQQPHDKKEKVVNVAKQPPPPRTVTHTTTSKLIHYKTRPVQLNVMPTSTGSVNMASKHIVHLQQCPAFPPFSIKLQFRL